jgi:hypothetical protein
MRQTSWERGLLFLCIYLFYVNLFFGIDVNISNNKFKRHDRQTKL